MSERAKVISCHSGFNTLRFLAILGMEAKARRPVGIMLSSSFSDLKEKRQQVLGLMGRHEFHEIAMENDSALSTLDKIDSSLTKVERAEAYICIIGYRYGTRQFCQQRNPQNLSLTELEWHRAKERGIPRCTLVMSPNYSDLRLADIELVSDQDRQSLAALRKLIESDRVCASFENNEEFQIKAMQSLEQLRRDIDELDIGKATSSSPSPVPVEPPSRDDKLPVAAPKFHFARRPYLLNQRFEGRTSELAQLDSWAMSKDSMLVFQAIGGMGKSMLTWHWIKHCADKVRPDWAGRLWYSFYEQGADLNDFCVQALAYIRNLRPKVFRGNSTRDLGEELRRELDSRPWLLVLDGLERVLVAYNRFGKEHMSDLDVRVMQDGLSLER